LVVVLELLGLVKLVIVLLMVELVLVPLVLVPLVVELLRVVLFLVLLVLLLVLALLLVLDLVSPLPILLQLLRFELLLKASACSILSAATLLHPIRQAQPTRLFDLSLGTWPSLLRACSARMTRCREAGVRDRLLGRHR